MVMSGGEGEKSGQGQWQVWPSDRGLAGPSAPLAAYFWGGPKIIEVTISRPCALSLSLHCAFHTTITANCMLSKYRLLYCICFSVLSSFS